MNNNNFTTNKIDFLHQIDKSISLNKSGKFYYLKLYEFNIENIKLFLSCIKEDQIYTVFPFISETGCMKDPYLRLSYHFLVTNQSNPELIEYFLNDQWNNTSFTLDENKKVILYLKIKKVFIKSESF